MSRIVAAAKALAVGLCALYFFFGGVVPIVVGPAVMCHYGPWWGALAGIGAYAVWVAFCLWVAL